MKIRKECPFDYNEIYELVKISFATSSHSDGTESDYLNELRRKDTFIPELSLVAEQDDGKLVGQVVLSKTSITTPEKTITELLLSPICVHPDYFRLGIAQTLMETAFKVAKSIGYRAVFLCGEPQFYRRISFVPTYEYNIFHVTDIDRNAEWCMVRELAAGTLKDINGTINIM